ncbi:MAG: YaiO family outer membrane beta-barrel protein [Bacteroidota bacterium]
MLFFALCIRLYLKHGVLTCLLWGVVFAVNAQDKPSPDIAFKEAQAKAFASQYAEARVLLSAIVAEYPSYTDAIILIGRTYAWQKDYANARKELEKVLAVDPDNEDALNAIIDVGLWSENPDDAIRYADIGLGYFPNSEDFLLKKARAFILKDEPELAAIELNRLLTINPTNEEALKLLAILKKSALHNFVTLRYYLALFDDGTKPWHLASAEYGRLFRRLTLIGRVNFASRPLNMVDNSYQSGLQGEIDAFPILGKGTYAYLNAGYSNDILLFPRTRFGAELFQKLPRGFEISAGARLLNFPDLRILLYTASLSKYYRDFLFTLRGYASFDAAKINPTVQFSARKYFGSDNYVMLTLSRGVVPGVAIMATQIDLQRLNSSRVAIDFQKGLGRSFYLLGGSWYEYEEYFEGKYRNRYTLHIGIQKKF